MKKQIKDKISDLIQPEVRETTGYEISNRRVLILLANSFNNKRNV